MTYADRTIDQFLSEIASENVTPAGGTAAAVVGAVGASLCEMVCIHTIGDGAGADAELIDVRDDLRTQRAHLLGLADADSEVVDELVAEFPDGPSERTAKRSIGVPLTIARACLNVVEHAPAVVENGSANAVPDAVIGAVLARGALEATVFTVRWNLEEIADPSFVEAVERRTVELEDAADGALERATGDVGGRR